jgi:hypothetical protein
VPLHAADLVPLLLAAGLTNVAAAQTYQPPDRIEVLPVFVVPQGEPEPTATQIDTLMAHVNWSRERFHEMLDCRVTFAVHEDAPQIHAADHAIEHYQQLFESGVPQMTSELLDRFGYGRFDTPHVYLMLVMNPDEDFPTGGGRPCNGGYDTGGGIIVMSSYALDNHPQFQSTIQHELGHAFGLPHVDVYGYDMATNPSIMSYNPVHHTDFFEPSGTPGTLIPEDVRGLAYNDKALPRLSFDVDRDLPDGYELAAPVWLGPMIIPGQPDNHVAASTPSGETFGSSVQNVVQGQIKPSAGPGVTFDPYTMWSSGVTESGWVTVDLEFPFPVELDGTFVHSQHSGLYHAAERVIVGAKVDQSYVVVADVELDEVDTLVSFDPTTAGQWRIRFRAGASDMVVIRGLQFYRGGTELFPPFIPEPVSEACRWDLDGDGEVAVGDLVAMITSCGVIDVADLVELILDWGPCG